MSHAFGRYGPTHPWLGSLASRVSYPAFCAWAARRQVFRPRSAHTLERAATMNSKVRAGAPVYLLGIGAAGHNSGVSLVEVTRERGVRLICNNEEERFSGVKHCTEYPRLSVDALLAQMGTLGLEPRDIHACLASWDYPTLASSLVRTLAEELPASWRLLFEPDAFAPMNAQHVSDALEAPRRLGKQLGLPDPVPIVSLRHHDNHAWLAYGVSPFASSDDPVMVCVLDGFGDDGAISIYLGQKGQLTLLRTNHSIVDSLGGFYSVISSTQGGWTILSSEGRYMGAAAWGNGDRLTNPFYTQLRQLFYFNHDGHVHLNRALANWPRKLLDQPYTPALVKVLGPPIRLDAMWSPDAVLRVEEIAHAPVTQERFDKAAAAQMVFEDVLFHIVGYLARTYRSHKLVLTGGTALNAIANMRLLQHFDESYYERYLGRRGVRLHLWVPPIPGDAGAPIGAACHFAFLNGHASSEPLAHAFYCGVAPTGAEIRAALATPEIAALPLGNVSDTDRRQLVADLVAWIISHGGVAGLFQGVAETGPRALGHRSILADPRNPDMLSILNRLVKYREAVRPLAPMATREAAHRWFELEPGASDLDDNAYNYMVLTARARPETYAALPAVVHKDGTCRVQIVREATDPFTHAYLKAMGRRAGVEVSVNTSLNVGSPIVQTPVQALEALKRSKGMDALFLLGAAGDAFLAWHTVSAPPKDGGERLQQWLRAWEVEIGACVS
jgi:carbamoyltransferase